MKITHLESGKVNNAVNVGVRLEDFVESGLVGHIELSELRLLAGDQFNALESLVGGVVEVVCDNNLVASLDQGEGGEGANVTGTTVMRMRGVC